VKRLRRIEIVAFRRRTIVVASRDESARSANNSAGCVDDILFAMSDLSAADYETAKTLAAGDAAAPTSSNFLSKVTRRSFSRLRTRLNNLRYSRSKNNGGQNEHS
jgi:hypothetical protein